MGRTVFCTALYGPWVLGFRHFIWPMGHGKMSLNSVRVEHCAEAGDEYDTEYPYLTSSGEDSDTGNNSPGTREHHRRVPQIGFPTVRCATAPGVPKWKGFLRGIESVYLTGTGDEGDEPGSGGHGGREFLELGLILGIGSGGEVSGGRSSREELRP